MDKSIFYSSIEENQYNDRFIQRLKDYLKKNTALQVYLVSSPLGDKYTYSYEGKSVVILSPKHKIIFFNLSDNNDAFKEYKEDFIEDLNSISDKFEYKEHLGRPRVWKKELIAEGDQKAPFDEIFSQNRLDRDSYRKCDLLISLLIGSINDISKVGIETPDNLLDSVRKNIILFDGEQTRFIYQDFENKKVAIQGLSGTGKTELLLHKLKEIYLSENNYKIFFTCHSIALSNTLKKRIPKFFDFMKVEKQIDWDSRLWVARAWGSAKDKNSGLYTYLCHFYSIPFLRFDYSTQYSDIFSLALDHINKIKEEDFSYALDYILIDESQDFPEVFFELCEKIAKEKIYVAGDIFQDIHENSHNVSLEVDIVLNRCYRTDPRTLMFAHAAGLGLFENKKLNWFTDYYWNSIGYQINRIGSDREVELSREPIRRFEDLETDKIQSVIIEEYNKSNQVIGILKKIQKENKTVTPDDIAIIILDKNKAIFEYFDQLSYQILEELGWEVNRAYENKSRIDGSIYLTNSNHVKGLEFPFVICVTSKIQNSYRYRNILYTMLTRSFIQSYLLVREKTTDLVNLMDGLKVINDKQVIKTIEPTGQQKEEMRKEIVKINSKKNVSYRDFMKQIFKELKIDEKYRRKFIEALNQAEIERFDKPETVKFIQANKEFYCK